MNRYLAQLADLQWLNVFIGGAVLAALYFFLMMDDGSSLKTEIEQGGIRLEEAKRQLAQTEKAMQDANRFEREVRETARQFESIVDYMPLTLSASDLHSTITKNASFAGVRVAKLEPKGQDVTAGFYQTTRMGMVLEGTFAQVVSFLANLSRAPNLLTLEDTLIKSTKSDDGIQRLTFEAVLVGYRYIKDAPADTTTPPPAVAAPAVNP
ncbi:MAG: type 4a pilus biogenesis protein PilO [Bdellovibrionota bacterium]